MSKKVVADQLNAGAGQWADGQPVESEGVPAGNPVLGLQWEEVVERLLLPTIEHIALELGDYQRQASDLGGEVPQFDAAEVGEWDLSLPPALPASLVDLVLDLPHCLIGDDQEVPRAAGGVKTRSRLIRLLRLRSFRGLTPASSSLARRSSRKSGFSTLRMLGTLV